MRGNLLRELGRFLGSNLAASEQSVRRRGIRNRKLTCEPLENRCMLAPVVTGFAPSNGGFVVEFSESIDSTVLNLYDGESAIFGAADVSLVGDTVGPVKGSLVVEEDRATFVASARPLPADTYTLTLRSGEDAFKSSGTDGQLLDGEYISTLPSGDGNPGNDFVYEFILAPPRPIVVSLPDFVRAQELGIPEAAEILNDGIPITINDADGVASIAMHVNYHPDLLTITGARLGPDAPAGSTLSVNVGVPGEAVLDFTTIMLGGGQPLGPGPARVITLDAYVPGGATYGAAHVLDITDLEVSDIHGDVLGATDHDAVHLVALMGDLNNDRSFDTDDPPLIAARVGLGLDSGFDRFPTIDPMIIADVTSDGTISPLDCSHLMEEIVGGDSEYLPLTQNQFYQIKADYLETYAPRVWLASEEPFFPSSVEWSFKFLDRVWHEDDQKWWLETKEPLETANSMRNYFYGLSGDVPAYAFWHWESDDAIDLLYMFYYTYNLGKYPRILGSENSTCFGSHVGDWEHVTVRLTRRQDEQGRWTLKPSEEEPSVYLAAHDHGECVEWDEIPWRITPDDTHTNVFSAHGSHGSYLTSGFHTYKRVLGGIILELYDVTSMGTEWQTWKALECFDWDAKTNLGATWEGMWPNWLKGDTGDPNVGGSDPASGPVYRWGNHHMGTLAPFTDSEYELVDGPTGPANKNYLETPGLD